VALVARLSFRARQRFSAYAVDRLDGQKVLRSNLRDRTVQNCSTCCSLANLPRDIRRELGVGWLIHQLKRLLNLLVGDDTEEGRLFELNGEALAEGAVEDWIARGVSEVGEDDSVLIG
jgi:hypothetical protein